jgi:cell surface protein SprA
VNYSIPLDKIPLTDWIKVDARYEVSYGWMTGALGQRDTLGNVIQNTRDRSLNGKLDFIRLYNKSKRLNALNAPKRPTIPGRPQAQPQADEEKQPITDGAMANILRFMMMIKEVNFRYQVTQGTFLPGYLENSGLLGMDRSFLNPGLDFVFGSQNDQIRFDLANRGMLAASTQLTQSFRQNRVENLQMSSLIEPLRDFRITLEVKKRETGEYSEIFRRESPGSENYTSINPNRMGAYSISYNLIRTVSARDDSQNNSPLFRNFENYRQIIQNRLETTNPGGAYNINGQDVLIPSFLAAYSGQDPTNISLNPFPSIPLPNWRLDYRGLSKLPALQEYFSSINLTHNYTSGYDASNFSNSLLYQDGLALYNRLQQIPAASLTDEFGSYIPIFILNDVVVWERFAPLIGVDLLTKDRMNISFEYNTERNIGLNFSNAQVTERMSQDFRFDLGYTKAGVKVPFKIQGRQEVLSNDLTFRLSTRIVDTQTIQRKIEEINTLTDGNLNVQLRPSIGYVVNQKLNVQFYFDRTINDPKVSTAFRRSSTAFGGQLTFNLSQ